MDSLRKNSTQTNGYDSYLDYSGNDKDSDSRKGSKHDDDDDIDMMIAPPEPSTSISASSLRPSASRSCVASPYINAYQLLNMDAHNDDVNTDRDHRETNILGNGNDDGKHHHNLKPAAESSLARSSIPPSSTPSFGRMPMVGAKATILNSVSSSGSSSIYGTKNTKRSLEDDDPSDSTANIMDHLKISSSLNSAHLSTRSSGRKMLSTIGGITRSPGMKDDRKINGNIDNAGQSFSPAPGKASNLSSSFENTSTALDPTESMKSNGSAGGWQQPHSSSHSPSSTPQVASAREWTKSNENENNPVRIARPKNDEDYNYDDNHVEHGKGDTIINDNGEHINKTNGKWNGDDNNIRPTQAHSAASTNQDDFIPLAKEHTRALLSAVMPSAVSSTSDAIETNTSYIRELMECCKKNQETLKENLSKVLEEEAAVATNHLMELVSISDEICAAIEAGEDALEREKERTKKKKVAEGPTIELLEENRDVFSLICMLRAPSEKRMQAAMALMKFAKDDQLLRDEIISSGGIHSCLTLFQQTRGITRELKVVASLAVAYILPSYVASSQTTSSIGLKLVECLHFLAASKPVSPNGIVITIEEMCKAASVGVNVLWINSIQPLIAIKKLKDECTSSPPSLRPGKTVSYGRLRSRTG
jgi:hypothetical protein